MAGTTAIEWTDATWNVITGCSRVSRGCGGPDGGGCYAERLAATRLRHHPSRKGLTDRRGRWTGEVRWNGQWLDQPLRWRRPRRIFVCAHSDLFHDAVPREWIDSVFGVMALCRRHVFQVLTKRPRRMRRYVLARCCDESSVLLEGIANSVWDISPDDLDVIEESLSEWPPPNVWLGTSVEDQPTADQRIPLLTETPAAVRWISAEPLLSPIDLRGAGLDWVVAGGESGPNARPMDPDWVRSLRDQCEHLGARFFFKQWGGVRPKARGRVLDGKTWDGMPLRHSGDER